jgi:5'-deoxynucleotidase YfbR-like HD superfamily hydrolase
MRQAKFTKEMQGLRAREQAFEQQQAQYVQAAKERDALVEFWQNKEQVQAALQKFYPDLLAQAQAQAAAQAPFDPNDIATVGQAQELAQATQRNLESLMQNLERGIQERIEAATVNLETKQATAKLASELNTLEASLFEAHPYIETLNPDAKDLLRYNVAKMEPRTPEEAKEAFKTVFGGMVENFNKAVAATTKSQVIAKQTLVKNNIQPPGGATVQPQPTDFKTTNKFTGKTEVDWAKLSQAALDKWNG